MENDALDKLISGGMTEWDDVKISTALDSKDIKISALLPSGARYTWDSTTSSISTLSTSTSTGFTIEPSYTPMTLDEIELHCDKYASYIKESVRLLERYTDDFVAGQITEVGYLKNIEDVVLKRSTYKLACSLLQEIKKED